MSGNTFRDKQVNTRPTDAQIIHDVNVRSLERQWRDLKARYGHLPEFADLIRRDIEGEAS